MVLSSHSIFVFYIYQVGMFTHLQKCRQLRDVDGITQVPALGLPPPVKLESRHITFTVLCDVKPHYFTVGIHLIWDLSFASSHHVKEFDIVIPLLFLFGMSCDTLLVSSLYIKCISRRNNYLEKKVRHQDVT